MVYCLVCTKLCLRVCRNQRRLSGALRRPNTDIKILYHFVDREHYTEAKIFETQVMTAGLFSSNPILRLRMGCCKKLASSRPLDVQLRDVSKLSCFQPRPPPVLESPQARFRGTMITILSGYLLPLKVLSSAPIRLSLLLESAPEKWRPITRGPAE